MSRSGPLIATMVVGLMFASSPAQSQSKATKTTANKADQAAAQILKEQGELDGLSWYGDVYPALKKKYGKEVTRTLYDAWRERYFEDVIAPYLTKHGYSTATAHQDFMSATEKQPPN
jgi:hypothetical protein